VFLCCKVCIDEFEAAPERFVARLEPPPQNEVLTIPRAVVDTGSKKIVYVEREPGVFDGIEVELGRWWATTTR